MTGAWLGREAKFYLNSGSFGSPTWSEVPNISDLTRNGEWETVDASTRESSAKMAIKTLIDFGVSGKLKFAAGDGNTVAIMDAFFSPDAVIDIMVLNGALTRSGAYGVRYQCQVTSDNEDQGLSAAVFEDLKFMPTPGNPPASVKVVSGAPVFTLI